jgi:RNA-splicing ligase RtcB
MRKRECIYQWMNKTKMMRRKRDALEMLCNNLKEKMRYVMKYWVEVNINERISEKGRWRNTREDAIIALQKLIEDQKKNRLRELIKRLRKDAEEKKGK